MKYFARVNDKEFEIVIDSEQEVIVNGVPYEIDFQLLHEDSVLSLLLNNRSLEAVINERDDVWEVLTRGELYTVRVQDERMYRLAQARGSSPVATGEAQVRSPMPGVIVAVAVFEGDVVRQGDKVVILESMKMENELRAPRDGIISRVNVSKGDSVEKDQVLVVISEPGEEG
ncbi:MAG TPA: acetyl-CoA carboxylase biotin carboxyl carrier protein subunit [Chloroflexota bacterium]|nr:acetyl-CoA carboxylase biotin carboxyl carrier protein subunit [Chloroflexota bacterium]HUM68732.1 acetyl-CoA carboxylase biotin carboxyl carrier protein subunit [Chloroflexota bacterium]